MSNKHDLFTYPEKSSKQRKLFDVTHDRPNTGLTSSNSITENQIVSYIQAGIKKKDLRHIDNVHTLEFKETSIALSEYGISKEGGFQEYWSFSENIMSRILEVGYDYVILECMVDEEQRVIQNRRFERVLFENAVPLKQYQVVLLQIFKRPGEFKVKISNGEKLLTNPDLFTESFDEDFPLYTTKL